MPKKCDRMNLMCWTREPVEHRGKRVHLLAHLRCKQWDCELCASENGKIWRRHLDKRLPRISHDWYFMTLTARPQDDTYEKAYKALSKGIDKLMKRFRRTFGQISYVRIFEAHKERKALHAHILVAGVTPYVAMGTSVKHQVMSVGCMKRVTRATCWAIRSWLKKTSWEVGLGYIADIKPVTGQVGATKYVTKYMTKQGQGFSIKGLRHVATSRDVGSPKSETEYDWKVGSYVTWSDFDPKTPVLVVDTGETLTPWLWDDDQRWRDGKLWDVGFLGDEDS